MPKGYCRGTDYGEDGWLVPKPNEIEQGDADFRLGRGISSLTNPAMTARQHAAAAALYYLGWFVAANAMHDYNEAAEAKQRQPLSEAQVAAERTVSFRFRGGRTETEQLEIYRRNMTETLKTYVQYLSDSEAKPIFCFIAEMEALSDTSPSGDDMKGQAPAADDYDEILAALFDPVRVDVLEKMFPADGKWKRWTDRAARNGLIHAREGTAMYNPYKAGMWFVANGQKGLTIGHCRRMLANNHLPDRSLDKKYLLIGELD